jgi:tetratricopeptide (TPR) repeat protein
MEKNHSNQTIAYGRALVRAIEALDAIATTDQVGQTLADQLIAAYEQQLQTIAETAPSPVAEAILKEKALIKSRHRCCVCHQFAGQDINVFHIDPDIKDPPDSLENAIVLCLRCNAEAVYASSQNIPGNKYSLQELRRHRDLWWQWCEKNPDATIPSALPGAHREHLYVPFPSPETDVIPEPGPLPPGSRLPLRRNALFTGRSEPLSILARALLPQSPTPQSPILITQAAQGMGGVGKTQLAIEFAYRYGRFFRGIHWLNCTPPQTPNAEIATCGEEMDLPYWPKEQSAQVARTLEEWREGEARLVVLDNVENTSAVRVWLERLGGGPTRLLLTARQSDWPADLGLTLLPLDVFTLKESLAFLRHHIPSQLTTDAELEQLAQQLGYLPLALDLAGRYLARHPQLSVETYLHQLEAAWVSPQMAPWREKLGAPIDLDLKLATTFALSWQGVADDAARNLFLIAGRCAPNQPIPSEILEEATGLETGPYSECLDILTDLGLLHVEDAGPIAHPLLTQYARALPKTVSPLPALAHLARAANKQMDRSGNVSHFVPLLPHVYAVTEEEEEEENLEAIGTLWNSLGYYLDQVENHAAAQAAFGRALAIWQVAYGPLNPQVATAHSNLGGALQAMGDLSGALAAFERALAIDETAYGPDHPDVARDMNNLGDILLALSDPRGAWSAYVCALAILEHVLGPDHPSVATQYNRVGVVLQKLDDLAGAQTAFEHALRILEELLPSGHPHVRAVQENLEALASIRDRTALARLSMRPISIRGPSQYFVCPECGAVREEMRDAEGAIARVKYHGLNSDTLSKMVVEKARAILEQIKPEHLKLLDADKQS